MSDKHLPRRSSLHLSVSPPNQTDKHCVSSEAAGRTGQIRDIQPAPVESIMSHLDHQQETNEYVLSYLNNLECVYQFSILNV